MSIAKQALTTAAAVSLLDKDKGEQRVSQKPSSFKEAFLARPITWLIVGGVAAFVGYKIYKKVAKGVGEGRSARQEKKDLEQYEQLQRQKNQVPSYSDYEYKTMADALFVALKGGTEDEEDFEPVMRKMKNNLDVAKLIQAFGTRDVSASWSPWAENHTLTSAVAKYFYESELEKYINAPLRRNGVTFQFEL